MNPIQVYNNIGCEFIVSESNNFIIGAALKGYNTLNDSHIGSYIPYLVRNVSSNNVSWEIGTGFVDRVDNKIVIRDKQVIESHGSLTSEGQKVFYIFAHANNYNTGFNNVIIKSNDFVVDKVKSTYLIETNDLIHATLPDATDCEAVEIYFKIIGDANNSKLDIRDNNGFHKIIKGQDDYLLVVSDGNRWIVLSSSVGSYDTISTQSYSEDFSALSDPVGEDGAFQYKDGSSFAGANVFAGSNNKVLFGSGTIESAAKHIIPTSGEYDFIINNTQDRSDFIVRGSGLPSGYLPKNLIFTYDGKLGLNLPSGTRPQTALHIINNSCRESIRIENLSSCPTHVPNITLYHKPSSVGNNTVISKIVSSSKDSNSNKIDYASIEATAKTTTANSAQGKLDISVISGVNSITTISTEANQTVIGSSKYNIICNNTSGIKLFNNSTSGVIGIGANDNIDINTANAVSVSGSVISNTARTSIGLSAPAVNVTGNTNINQALVINSGGSVAFPLISQNQILAINNSGFLAPATGFSFGGIGPNRILATNSDSVVSGPLPINAFLPTYNDFTWSRYSPRAAILSQRQVSFIDSIPAEEFAVGDQVVITTGVGANLTYIYRNISETALVGGAISGVLLNQSIGNSLISAVVGTCASITKGGVLTIQAEGATDEIASEATAISISTRPNVDTIFNTAQKDINFKVFGIEAAPAINVLAKGSLTPLQSGEYFTYATQFKDSLGNQIRPFIIPLNTGVGVGVDNTNNSAVFGNQNISWSGRVSSVGTNGRPSFYGTYDQNGNVFEWTSQPNAQIQNICGGSWRTSQAEYLRSVIPTPYDMEFDDVGFRVCRRYGFNDTVSKIQQLAFSFVPVSHIENLSDSTSVFTEHYNNRTGLLLEPDPTGFFNLGRVTQPYEVGKYQITNSQYSEFLNAVNKITIFDLYNAGMSSNSAGGIVRTGSEGSYEYYPKEYMQDKPVVFISYLSAIRFTNWLHNGAPTGTGVNSSHTEEGAYTIIVNESSTQVIVNKYQKYWIPTLNEWHKAAYFRPIVNTVTGDRSAVSIRTDEPYEIGSGNLASLTVNGTVFADEIIVGRNNETQGSLILTKEYSSDNVSSGLVNIAYGYLQYGLNIGPSGATVIDIGSEDWDGEYSTYIASSGIQLATSGSIKLISPSLISASGISVDDMFIKNLNFLNENGDLIEGGLYPGPNGGFIYKNLDNDSVSASNILTLIDLDSTSGIALSNAGPLAPIYANDQGVLQGYSLIKFDTEVEFIDGKCVTIGATGTGTADALTLVVDAIRIGPPLDSFAGSVLVHDGTNTAKWQPGDFLRADGMTWNRYKKRAVEILNSNTLRFIALPEQDGGTGSVTKEEILQEFGLNETFALYNQDRDVTYFKLADIVLLEGVASNEFFNNEPALEILICPPLTQEFIDGALLEVPGGEPLFVGYAFSVYKGAYLNMSIEPGATNRFSCAGINTENAVNGFKPSTINTISIRPTIDTIFNRISEDINFTIYGYKKTLNNRYEAGLFAPDSRGVPVGLTPAFHIESYIDNSFKGTYSSGVFNDNDKIIASGIMPDEFAKIMINTRTPYTVARMLGVVSGFIYPDDIRPTGQLVTTSSDISTYADLTVNGYAYSSGIITTEIILKNAENRNYIPNAPLTINSMGQLVSIVPPAPPTIPGPPSSVVGFGANSSVRLSWTPPADNGNSAILDYVIEYSDNDTEWNIFEHNTLTDDEIVVDGLENGVAYKFRISATNAVGTSVSSVPSSNITPTSNAPSKPINLTIISRTESSIVLDWAAPFYIGPVGATLQSYIVDYATATSPPGSLVWETVNTGMVSDITIAGLSSGPTYYIRVRAQNSLAQGAYEIIKSIGDDEEPQPPEEPQDPSEVWDFGVVQFTGVCL